MEQVTRTANGKNEKRISECVFKKIPETNVPGIFYLIISFF